jgi:hypothetical protein
MVSCNFFLNYRPYSCELLFCSDVFGFIFDCQAQLGYVETSIEVENQVAMARHVWRQTSRSIRQWKRLVKAWTLHSKDKEWQYKVSAHEGHHNRARFQDRGKQTRTGSAVDNDDRGRGGRGEGVRGRVDQRVGIHIAKGAGVDRRVDAQTAVPLRQVMDMLIGAAEHAPEVRKIHSS